MYTPSFEYFLEIAKVLNFSVAAQKTNVSQQNLSTYMQKLENYYGVKLLDRKPVMKLTKAGEVALEAAEKIDEILSELNNELSRLNRGSVEPIKIGIAMPVENKLPEHFPMTEYHKMFPYTSFVAERGRTEDLRGKLREGKIDMLIGPYATSYDRKNSDAMEKLFKDFNAIEFYEETEHIMIADRLLKEHFGDEYPGCIEKFKSGVELSRFANVPAVVVSPCHMRSTFDKYFSEKGMRMNIVMETLNRTITKSFIYKGLAYGCFGSGDTDEITEDENAEPVYAFPIKEPDLVRKIGVFYRRQDEYLDYFKALIDMIKEKNMEPVENTGEERQNQGENAECQLKESKNVLRHLA